MNDDDIPCGVDFLNWNNIIDVILIVIKIRLSSFSPEPKKIKEKC